jgi:hypothetical protein
LIRHKKWTVPVIIAIVLAVTVIVISFLVSAKQNLNGANTDVTPKETPTSSISPTPTPTPIPTENVDVVIIGSELEGMYLARAAADEGLKVKIIDPRDQIGGQLIQGEMLFLDETKDDQGKSLLQGRVKELFDGFKSAKIRKLPEFVTYFDKLRKDIPIVSGARIEKVETATKSGMETVSAIQYSTKSQPTTRLTASYWVDNSDYTALASRLKANRLPGLEALYGQDEIEYMSSGMMMKFKNVDWARFSSQYNSLTPEQQSKQYGGGVISENYAIGLTGMARGYKATNERVFLRGLNAVNQRDGEVLINAFLIYTVDPSKEPSIAEAMALGKKEIPLILEHFRKSMVGWEKAELNGFPNYLYIREYNHYETEHVLTVSDALGGRMFYDNVSIAGYPLDLQGTSANKWGIEMGRPDKYGMPLRSFLLKGYDNVILAGKNVGSSAIAYGSARIQPNTSIAAESIGVIIGKLKGTKKLIELRESDWPELHTYLASKYGLVLTGVTGRNKIANWTADEIKKLNEGKIIYPAYVNTRKP